jgi:EF-hand domain pair
MGVAIEPSETFYFRHDSYRNPGYENNLEKETKNYGEFRKMVSDRIMNSNLMKRILDKISSQWKTLKKAFSDLNQEKNGWISEVDLKKYLTNWGFNITEEQFREFYEFLDYDRDGHITYDDFKKSVGSVISPVEFLYFRQDLPRERST